MSLAPRLCLVGVRVRGAQARSVHAHTHARSHLEVVGWNASFCSVSVSRAEYREELLEPCAVGVHGFQRESDHIRAIAAIRSCVVLDQGSKDRDRSAVGCRLLWQLLGNRNGRDQCHGRTDQPRTPMHSDEVTCAV